MAYSYQTFMLADEPKIAGIPVTTGVPVFLLTAIGLVTGFATTLFLIGTALSLFMHFKFGGLSLRILLSMVYWSFPQAMTHILFRTFPNSANRVYIR
ncbi:type IV conjugative transfer system protein TraL [Legionella septentrionalis]|uniref:type IV conjugative transfer system protein TraL n=1 Tax=Legionella septentrionalis TaxID=2498109 RepID=UPI000F8D2A8C|nr:type IV conjugative transfer system protein TraL [Legionella septentrionalis]RUQ96647.1 type IV conjugative transfer system protein TraL [Legionella septentrionalis]